MEARLLSPNDIKNSLVNLPQIVFEVTDDCNLKCVYCAYGELYCDYDNRSGKNMKLADVKLLIDYLADLWNNNSPEASVPETYIGFYGGEPLLNVSFIKEVIEYIESLNLNRRFKYSLTTNAVLLDRYMTFLVEKNFSLLISLDGDEYANSYRVNKAGRNSFKRVLQNVLNLKNTYPDYYESQVSFNSVLHDRNDVAPLLDFFKKELSKRPELSELSTTGLNPKKKGVFDKMYNSIINSYHKAIDYETLSADDFMNCPEAYALMRLIEAESNNILYSYKQLLPSSNKEYVPTGTCIPFSRKMFVTVNGKILPCERISHAYSLGRVTHDHLDLNIKEIVEKHNGYLKKVLKNCTACANKYNCLKCIYQIDELNCRTITCDRHMSAEELDRYNKERYSLLKSKKGLYHRVLESLK
jgi:uncharacterized protein